MDSYTSALSNTTLHSWFHSWSKESFATNILCTSMQYLQKMFTKYWGVRPCLSIWADQAFVTACVDHTPWDAMPNPWQQRDRNSRSGKALPAAAPSQILQYTWGSIIPILVMFLENLHNCNELGLPRDISALCKMFISFSVSLLWVKFCYVCAHLTASLYHWLENLRNKKGELIETVLSLSREESKAKCEN